MNGSLAELRTEVEQLRARLEPHFGADTAAAGFPRDVPSGGHCAAVSVIAAQVIGAELMSARVEGLSHWFNRIGPWDVDLTGDQFGLDAVQIAPAGELYVGTQTRRRQEVDLSTIRRALLLARRAGIELSADSLQQTPV